MLVLRICHNRKTRYISFNLHLKQNQYDIKTGKITGVINSGRHTKRTQKTFSDVELWIDENEGEIKNWEMDRLKSEIEQRFFKISPSRTILNHGGKYLSRLRLEQPFSTASSYEDALKSLIKYRRHLKGMTDTKIKTLQ